MEFIERQQVAYPAKTEVFRSLGELHTKKLWHQLTLKLFELVNDPSFSGMDCLALYTDFISHFETKLNQLSLVRLLVAIGTSMEDKDATIHIYGDMLEKESRLGPAASLMLQCELGLVRLRGGDLDGLKEMIESGRTKVEGDGLGLTGAAATETCVHSAFYQLASEYHKVIGPPEAFYKDALMYLAYTPLETLPKERQCQLAVDISLAAIAGDGVFNFGEVVATSAVKALNGTSSAWLGDLLQVFNRGDIDAFNLIVSDRKEEIAAQPALVNRADFIKEKMALMSLVNLVFQRPPNERNIDFSDIACQVKLPLDQVEWIIMRAMSVGLIRGTMDEVNQNLHVSWVQPRTLDNQQLSQVAAQVGSWKEQVSRAHLHMNDSGAELFA
eukprot:202530_1